MTKVSAKDLERARKIMDNFWGGQADASSKNDVIRIIAAALCAEREAEQQRAVRMLKKLCWSEKEIQGFLDWDDTAIRAGGEGA